MSQLSHPQHLYCRTPEYRQANGSAGEWGSPYSGALKVRPYLEDRDYDLRRCLWYMIFAAVVLAFLAAYAATFGFDKLKEALGQIRKQ